jgi:adenosylhomocysteinase
VENGKLAYQWASNYMSILHKIKQKNQKGNPLFGFKLGLCLHITRETSVLVMTARDLGAEIALCSANPLTVNQEICTFLSSEGINTFAWRNETDEEYNSCIRSVLDFKPDIIIDDGSDLHIAAHKYKSKRVCGGTEETTSGVKRLKSLQTKKRLLYPVIAVNNAFTKYMFDNRYGTGQSVIEGIIRATGVFLGGKKIVICGYGWVGRGVAATARGMKALVIITEIDPIRALEAYMDGFYVKPLIEVAEIGDIFITCSGQKEVIRQEHIERMKNGVILTNAGHFDVEIDVKYLKSMDCNPVRLLPYVDCYSFDGKKVYLVAQGRVVNLVCADGNPSEIMALSFANQLLSIIFIAKND